MAYESERGAMVNEQLVPRGIGDKEVLAAFRKVPRHEFVPRSLLKDAYGDYPLPIGEGQTISQPYMVALMTECLGLSGVEKTLEIGTGSGYQTAILAELAKTVYSVERFQGLSETAAEHLNSLGYKNVHLKAGDGTLGWKEFAPYDRILVTAGAPDVPKSLLSQLKENGRLVIPLGSAFSQVLMIVEKKSGKFFYKEMGGCVFVPLVGKEGWEVKDGAG
ncbi:MAG: protein-L-isoaspartate(D-aspartate) O-methyltransferase [Candidatus Omnitrophica bacterium]|nr:protein-L-isoaspartate(D-aspartate) O-methyltransferase [Candidatus Omnitrophota bacterium]